MYLLLLVWYHGTIYIAIGLVLDIPKPVKEIMDGLPHRIIPANLEVVPSIPVLFEVLARHNESQRLLMGVAGTCYLLDLE